MRNSNRSRWLAVCNVPHLPANYQEWINQPLPLSSAISNNYTAELAQGCRYSASLNRLWQRTVADCLDDFEAIDTQEVANECNREKTRLQTEQISLLAGFQKPPSAGHHY